MALKVIRATQAVRESLATLITAIETADPALLVTPTAGNFLTIEEKLAELNIAASTAGVATAVTAAQTAYLAARNAYVAAIAPSPLGEGIDGTELEAVLASALATAGLSVNGVVVDGSIEIGLAEFTVLLIALLQLNRARTIITPALAANGK